MSSPALRSTSAARNVIRSDDVLPIRSVRLHLELWVAEPASPAPPAPTPVPATAIRGAAFFELRVRDPEVVQIPWFLPPTRSADLTLLELARIAELLPRTKAQTCVFSSPHRAPASKPALFVVTDASALELLAAATVLRPHLLKASLPWTSFDEQWLAVADALTRAVLAWGHAAFEPLLDVSQDRFNPVAAFFACAFRVRSNAQAALDAAAAEAVESPSPSASSPSMSPPREGGGGSRARRGAAVASFVSRACDDGGSAAAALAARHATQSVEFKLAYYALFVRLSTRIDAAMTLRSSFSSLSDSSGSGGSRGSSAAAGTRSGEPAAVASRAVADAADVLRARVSRVLSCSVGAPERSDAASTTRSPADVSVLQATAEATSLLQRKMALLPAAGVWIVPRPMSVRRPLSWSDAQDAYAALEAVIEARPCARSACPVREHRRLRDLPDAARGVALFPSDDLYFAVRSVQRERAWHEQAAPLAYGERQFQDGQTSWAQDAVAAVEPRWSDMTLPQPASASNLRRAVEAYEAWVGPLPRQLGHRVPWVCAAPSCRAYAERKCARCLVCCYCSEACQRTHWQEAHKAECVKNS